MKPLPLISIIIPTKNEGHNLTRCLTSLKNQSYPKNKIEIIVVDNHSIDNTYAIAKTFTPHVFTHGPERSAQRNFGLKKAQGLYFLYLDADMTINPNLILHSVKYLNNNSQTIGLYLKETITGSSSLTTYLNRQRQKYTATPIDAARFILTSKLKQIHGFDESLTAFEDWDLNIRLKAIGSLKLLNTKDSITHHQNNLTLIKLCQKKLYYLQSLPLYLKKWGIFHHDIIYQFNPCHRL